ncbi:hypothetical protein IXEL_40 [Microbacterium phage Ixel]|nr:hypothetical protein IXEL_40 [Microbacterium phage Ixel]
MATRKSTKSAAAEVEAVEAEVTAEATPKQIVNEGIGRVIEATGIDVQKNRYKAMRAIAWQAFLEAIEADEFDALVDRAIANVDELPSGWEIERVVADEKPAPKAKATPAKKAPAKAAAAKPAAKASARKRPQR